MKDIKKIVAGVIKNVRKNGDRAVSQITAKIDNVRIAPKNFRVSVKDMEQAYRRLDPVKRQVLENCARRIQEFHWHEKKVIPESWTVNQAGVRLGQIWSAMESVGIYVPGGYYSYPSTLLMTAIPASMAGVGRMVVVTPPRKCTDEILAAAKIAGIKEMYRVGGPAALAALAIGTKTIPKVDFIVGPGNALVTEAKRQLFGEVGIDLLAGPSELVVVADETANPSFVAADMAAQAEHDPNARAYLVATSRPLLGAVQKLIPPVFKKRCEFHYFSSMEKAVRLANEIAGEHVELMVKRPQECLDGLKNGGAFFIHGWSPAVMGDYWAGPSHVLPTGRSARFCSGLSVITFMKRSSFIDVSTAAYKKGWKNPYAMADMEGLKHHAESVLVRVRRGEGNEHDFKGNCL